jgi:diacylglycerol O-acyltransferase
VSTEIAKENHYLLGPKLVADWLNYLPPSMAPAAFRWQSKRMESSMIMNLTVSNVPGPRERGTFGGATISEIYSVGPLVVGSGMNVTVWSYVDQLNISVLTDDITLDDPHEATDAMVHAFTEIRSAAGLSGQLTDVHSAMAPARAVG